MVQKRDSGFSAFSLCLHSGCASGSLVEKLLLEFLYNNTSAGKSLLEIVYNRFRYHFRLFVVAGPFLRRASPPFFFYASHAAPFFFLRRASRVSFSVMLRDWAFLFHHFTPSLFSLSPEAQRSDVPTEGVPRGVRREL